MSISRRQVIKSSAVLLGTTLLSAGTTKAVAAGTTKTLEYRRFDGLALADLVRRKEVSPAQLLDIAIARTEQVNPQINAVVLQHYDLAKKAIAEGLPNGPFRGVPFLLKDLGIALKGTITTEGSRFFQDQVLDYDSTTVERYKKAGLVIFGKTHSPEFGNTATTETQLFGDTRNPWNLEHSAGGSSGGSAAAVAAGILPVAHASDGGGSIRIPASACGLFGMKPTRGRVPMGPHSYETRAGCSVMHVVSRSVRDSAALLDATAGAAVGDAYAAPAKSERTYLEETQRSPGKLRIALMTRSVLPLPVDPQCVQATQETAKLCESLGHFVEVAQPTVDVNALYEAFGIVGNVLVAAKVAQREQLLGRKVRANELEKINHLNLKAGREVSAVAYRNARVALHGASRALGEFMRDYDVILSPTMALLPPKLGALSLNQEFETFMGVAGAAAAFTGVYNMTGQPAMSVPLHWSKEGLPIGVMFAGRFDDEATLFRLAGQLEQASPWFDRLSAI